MNGDDSCSFLLPCNLCHTIQKSEKVGGQTISPFLKYVMLIWWKNSSIWQRLRHIDNFFKCHIQSTLNKNLWSQDFSDPMKHLCKKVEFLKWTPDIVCTLVSSIKLARFKIKNWECILSCHLWIWIFEWCVAVCWIGLA